MYQPDNSITLDAEFVQATDAWLYISVQSDYPHPQILLSQNGERINRFTWPGKDTLYRVQDLNIQTEYTYKAILKYPDERQFTSSEIQIVTTDTTDHITAWDDYFLGKTYGGLLWDIEAVNDNDVWAVGYMNYENSTRNGARWNGAEWELLEIPVLLWGTTETDSVFGTSNVYTIDSDNIQ